MRLLGICSILLALTACSDSSTFGTSPECNVVKENGINRITCNGETIEIEDGKDGRHGNNGSDGLDGSNGSDGVDGSPGNDGIDGTSGLFVAVHDPCGKQTSHDEVVLETRDGQFLAYLAGTSTTNSRLVLLMEGIQYTTTDGTNCRFKINNGVLID